MAKPNKRTTSGSDAYEVGYRRPPKEFRFEKGRSGNPAGTRRKPPSLAADLKASLERALNTKVKLPHGERDEMASSRATDGNFFD